MLLVKEIFGPTIQGEGETAGCPAIFIRFSGCNMWSGKPIDQAASQCPFCDTDFTDGEKMSVHEVVGEVVHLTRGKTNMLVVLSGGEPLLQQESDLVELVKELHELGYTTQVETNGTVNKPAILDILDFVTCSPKLAPEECKIDWKYVTALKLLYPHPNPKITPEDFDNELSKLNSDNIHRFLQPIDKQDTRINLFNTNATIQKVKELGLPWRLSLQTHKIINQP
jgi:organic radical activating enzyme